MVSGRAPGQIAPVHKKSPSLHIGVSKDSLGEVHGTKRLYFYAYKY